LWWLARVLDGSKKNLSIPREILTCGIILDYFEVFLLLLPVLVIRVALFVRTIMGLAARCTAWQLLPPRPWRRVVSLESYSLFLGVNCLIIIPVEDGQNISIKIWREATLSTPRTMQQPCIFS
jgi:hypothetical protein